MFSLGICECFDLLAGKIKYSLSPFQAEKFCAVCSCFTNTMENRLFVFVMNNTLNRAFLEIFKQIFLSLALLWYISLSCQVISVCKYFTFPVFVNFHISILLIKLFPLPKNTILSLLRKSFWILMDHLKCSLFLYKACLTSLSGMTSSLFHLSKVISWISVTTPVTLLCNYFFTCQSLAQNVRHMFVDIKWIKPCSENPRIPYLKMVNL